MAYRCDQAVIGSAEEPIRCKVSGNVCAHQKMCLMEGRIVLTDGALRCPARGGQLPERPAEAPARKAVSAKATTRTTATKNRRKEK